MNAKQLKRKLFGFYWVYIPLALVSAALTVITFGFYIYSCIHDMPIGSSADSVSFFLLLITCGAAASAFARRSDIRKNKGLISDEEALQRLVDEYNSPKSLHLKERKKTVNALLPSGIVMLNKGIFLPYSKIAKAHIIQYNVLKRRGNAVDITKVFTLITDEGDEIALFTVDDQETVKAAVNYILAKNPECRASGEIAEIKRS